MSRIHDAIKKAEQDRVEAVRSGLLAEDRPAAVGVREAPPPAEGPRPPFNPAQPTFADLLGHCRPVSWKLDSRIAGVFSAPNHVAGSEELRTLRSRLYQIRDRQPLRTILITSALPAEGKTFLTAGLAHTIVRQHERRALIIDADLRHSQMHQLLGTNPTPGLTEYLTGSADLLTVLQRGAQDNLFFIPGGKAASNHAELLGNGRLKQLLDHVEGIFDWVLVDSPPAIPVADASLMAAYCDGVLMVVQAASTPFDMAQKVRDEFHDKGLLGAILNRVDPGETYHSYYSDYADRGKTPRQK